MVSYKNRVKELEQAMRGIAEICSPHCFPPGHPKNIPVCLNVVKITDTVLSGGRLEQSGVTKKVRSLMSPPGQDIMVEIPVGSPPHMDPSCETYWSM